MLKNRNIDRRLVTILLIVFVQFIGASMVLPIMPLYADREFSMEPQVITLLVSSFFLAQFLAGPFLGRISDTYGRLPVLIASQIGTVISFFILASATSLEMLFLARILDGITGGNIIVAQAYITDITPREQRTQALGYIFAALGLGFVFGPATGGILSAVFGARIPFLFAAVAAIIPTVMTWRILDETLTPEIRARNKQANTASLCPGQILSNVPLMLILIVSFVGQFGLGIILATFALFGQAVLFADLSPQMVDIGVGLLLGMIGIGQLFTQLFLLRRFLGRLGEARLATAGAIARGGTFFLFAVITSPWIAAVGCIFFAIGSGLMMPSLQSLTTNTVPDEYRGGVLGIYQSSLSLATIFSTALAGTLFSISPQTPYWVGGSLFIVVILMLVYLVRWSTTHAMDNQPAPAAASD